jgi:NADPH:quinone reductase-like Zn-dependent oxidoreductase/ketosteroid isomerase-like protein
MVADGVGSVRLEQVRDPEPEPHQVVIAVEAFSLNRGELYLLEAAGGGGRPGKDIAGTVIAAAADGTGPAAGTRVVAHVPGGGWAERVCADVRALAALPVGLDSATAAALPLAGLTAMRLLRAAGPLIGRRVLITGASGGVGHYLTELAVAAGADVVAITRTPERGERLRQFGAGTAAAVGETPGWFDVAFESVGGASLAEVRRKVHPSGRIIWFGQASREPSSLDFFDWVQNTAGAPITQFHYPGTPEEDGRDLSTLVRLVTQGRLHPEIGTLLPWGRTGEAIELLHSRSVRGNAVLGVSPAVSEEAVARSVEVPAHGRRTREVLEHYLDVLVAGDLDSVADCFDPDAEWWLHGQTPVSGTKHGRAEIVQFLVDAGSLFAPGTQRFQFGQITAEGDRAVLEWRVTGVGAASGLAYDNSYCGVFVVRAGRIVEVREYLDSQHAVQVLFAHMEAA